LVSAIDPNNKDAKGFARESWLTQQIRDSACRFLAARERTTYDDKSFKPVWDTLTTFLPAELSRFLAEN
jgi:hypothetical protein